MTRTSYITLSPEQEDLWNRSLNSGDRFLFSKINKKVAFYSRKRKKGTSQKSLLPQIGTAWAGLTQGKKDGWTSAGSQMGLNGWRMFVQDYCARFANDIAGLATPSDLHQSWVGYLDVQSPADELKIVQLHPRAYWVSKKVGGKKGMYQPVLVTEDFALPLSIGLNYKSDLVSTGSGSFAKFYAEIRYSYQGRDREQVVEIPLDLSADWKTATASSVPLQSYVIGYTLFFHLYRVRGTLYVDNLTATHSGQNWVRDPFCKDLNQGFTRAFYQIPKHWVAEIMPDGSDYGSLYEDF